MIVRHFTIARPRRRRLDPVQCLIWVGVPAAWVILLAAILYRII